MKRLGLEVDEHSLQSRLSTTTAILPEDLTSLEQALKMFAGALKLACQSGFTRVEVSALRYRTQVNVVK